MVKLTINQQKIEVPAGSTILTAARQLGIEIPTMCFLEGYKPFTSCMICLVEEMRTGKMLPSCSALVEDGMVIETDNEKVDACRKEALELLLSEHVGDCLGPCHRTCPANMNIPLMLRQIARKEFAKALQTVKQDIALPAILGRICPAPCEKACRRKQHDAPVSICLLKRFVADVDLARKTPFLPECQPASGMKIAIVGTGPTGLAAAYYLQQVGYHCTLLEKSAKTAATLRENISEEILPPEVLDAEIALIQKLGATFQFQQELGRDFSLADLQKKFDTVILAIGTITENDEFAPGLEKNKNGIQINPRTFKTSLENVFAGGSVVRPLKMAVQAVEQGKNIAFSVNQFLETGAASGLDAEFNSQMGKLQNGEMSEFLRDVNAGVQIEPAAGIAGGYSGEEAIAEAQRCLHCDCGKPFSCKLREYATLYDARQQRYKIRVRAKFEKINQHIQVIYEPGKCIKCGLCVQITEKAQEKPGLTFIGRGFNVKIGVPFNDSFAAALEKVARECVQACPTGALVLKMQEDEDEN